MYRSQRSTFSIFLSHTPCLRQGPSLNCLCLPRPGITAACRHLHLFFLHRLCGFRTQVLVLVWHTLYPLGHLPKPLLSPWTRYVSCLHFSYLETHIYTHVANQTHKSVFSILQTQWHAIQSVGRKSGSHYWKLHFFIQSYELESLRYLRYLLASSSFRKRHLSVCQSIRVYLC